GRSGEGIGPPEHCASVGPRAGACQSGAVPGRPESPGPLTTYERGGLLPQWSYPRKLGTARILSGLYRPFREAHRRMTDPTERPLPTRLAAALGDAYTIEGEIGRGGMGVVYRARDERLQRRVAIKVLPPELAFQKDIRERFTREAQTAARLSHPHIVPIHTVGEGEGLVYFVMGYVDGESVGARIKRRGRLPVEEARRIMRETADALSAAHAVSIIHRDIKPDNILLEGTRGRVMVTDFGIAKALSATSGATLTGVGVAIG